MCIVKSTATEETSIELKTGIRDAMSEEEYPLLYEDRGQRERRVDMSEESAVSYC